jgi:putative transposase
VDQDGDVIDVYLQTRRDAETAKRFFRRRLRSHGKSPWKIATDKLRSYGVARRELMPATIHERQLVSAAFYRLRRARAFERWNQAVAT